MLPIRSMTGYGKGIAESDGRKITIEVKTVNHRFFDILVKLPRGYQFLEDVIRKTIAKKVIRGHIDVYFNIEDNRTDRSDIILNKALAKRYLEIAEELKSMGYADSLKVADVLNIQDMVTSTAEENDEDVLINLAEKATALAVNGLIETREAEGARLVEDLKVKVIDIGETADKITERAPLVAQEYREKLLQRVQEILEETEVDEAKLANEVTFFVDKSNIDEELTRLKGHVAAYLDIFKAGGEVGKKLDYYTQEANREVNTIASKSNDMITTKYALYLKNQVEKIREQVQNLE